MVEGVRLSKEELKSRYGLAERMAVRIGALLSKGLEVTGAVLEEAARTKELETLLLTPELLAKAASLDSDALRSMTTQPVSLVKTDGRRVLALEEETLAEQAWLVSREGGEAGRVATLPAVSTPQGVGVPTRGMFSLDEVGRIKLTLLTGVEPNAKIEALRKLGFAPLSTEERGVLSLRALGDSDAEVRREAAAALERLGLDRDLSDALRDASGGTPKQRQLALRKLASLAGRLSAVERSMTLSGLAALMEYEHDTNVLRELLTSLESFPLAEGEALPKFANALVKIVAEHLAEVGPAARALLDAMTKRATPSTAAALWRAVDSINERRLKVFFFEALARMPMDAELEATLCRRAAEELSNSGAEDFETRRLADALLDRGDAALQAILAVLPAAKEGSRAHLVGIVDAIATSTKSSDAGRAAAGDALLALLRQGSRLVRTIIMEAKLPWQPSLPAALKGRFAADFITNLHAYRVTRIHDLTAAAIRKIGFDAEDSLRECIRKSPYPVERETAVALIADIAAESTDARAVAGAIEFLRQQEDAGRVPAGLVVRAVGRACVSAAAPADAVIGVVRDYTAKVGRATHSFDLLAALGWAGASAGCDVSGASDIALRLVGLLESPMPDLDVTETKTGEGMHLVIGGSTRVYTDLVPDLVAGIRRVMLTGRLAPNLEDDIVRRLCAKYADLVDYKDVWAPGNVVTLAEALGEISSASRTPDARRCRIIETLLGNVRNITMVRVLGLACCRPEDESKAFAELAGTFGRKAFQMLERPEYAEMDDQWALTEAVARTARSRQVGKTKAESDEFKRRVADLLLERIDKFAGARDLAKRLSESPHLPKAVKKAMG